MVFKENKIRPTVLTKSIEVVDAANNSTGNIEIKVFETISKEKIGKVIRWQQSKARLGTHMTKDVSQLAYSTKKIRKQKGSGTARARNKGATHFRGGATVHGPDHRQYEYIINKKEKLLGLQHAISAKVLNKEILILKEIRLDGTVKSFKGFLKIHEINTQKILIVDKEKNSMILKSINNVYGVDFLPTMGLNVESVAKTTKLIFSENALMELKERGII